MDSPVNELSDFGLPLFLIAAKEDNQPGIIGFPIKVIGMVHGCYESEAIS
jgi:hypothetical protein